MRTGEQATISDRGQPHAAGRSPIPARPPSTPAIPANSKTLSRMEPAAPRWSSKIAVSPATIPRLWPRPTSTRPRTRTGNGPALHSRSTPATRSAGAAASDVPSRRPASNPVGTSAIMRAKPKLPARSPSCQSARLCARAISGRSGPNAPTQTVFANTIRHSSAVPEPLTRDQGVNGRSVHQG